MLTFVTPSDSTENDIKTKMKGDNRGQYAEVLMK